MRIHRHRTIRHRTAVALMALTALTLSACAGTDDAAEDVSASSAVTDVTVDDDGVTTLTPRRDGSGLPAPVDVLSASDEAALLFMREEERLAQDVYTVLGETWGLPIFTNIAAAEQTHAESVRVLLERYGLDDPVPSRPAGEYADATLQAAYDELIELGSRSLVDALRVGAIVEELDIADLRARPADAPDVAQVFDALERGSRNHLRAFVGQLEQRGAAYAPTHLTQDEVDEILAGDLERGPVSG
jgi:hypothetical protein